MSLIISISLGAFNYVSLLFKTGLLLLIGFLVIIFTTLGAIYYFSLLLKTGSLLLIGSLVSLISLGESFYK